MKTVGISDFVRNQIKKSGKSEIINISLEKKFEKTIVPIMFIKPQR